MTDGESPARQALRLGAALAIWLSVMALMLLFLGVACSTPSGPVGPTGAAPDGIQRPYFIKSPAERCAERGGRFAYVEGAWHCLAK